MRNAVHWNSTEKLYNLQFGRVSLEVPTSAVPFSLEPFRPWVASLPPRPRCHESTVPHTRQHRCSGRPGVHSIWIIHSTALWVSSSPTQLSFLLLNSHPMIFMYGRRAGWNSLPYNLHINLPTVIITNRAYLGGLAPAPLSTDPNFDYGIYCRFTHFFKNIKI